jgi:mannosyltransferase
MTTYAAGWLRSHAFVSRRLLVAGVVALGAALRFSELDARGFWRDEAVTVELVRRGFGSMLSAIPHSEGTPPLYYILAWGWTRIFGSDEAGLRSLSAVAGTAAVLVVYVSAPSSSRGG